jgi:hypothetical protein
MPELTGALEDGRVNVVFFGWRFVRHVWISPSPCRFAASLSRWEREG